MTGRNPIRAGALLALLVQGCGPGSSEFALVARPHVPAIEALAVPSWVDGELSVVPAHALPGGLAEGRVVGWGREGVWLRHQGEIRLVDPDSGDVRVRHPEGPRAFLGPSGRWLAVGPDRDSWRIYDGAEPEPSWSLDVSRRRYTVVGVREDGRLTVGASGCHVDVIGPDGERERVSALACPEGFSALWRAEEGAVVASRPSRGSRGTPGAEVLWVGPAGAAVALEGAERHSTFLPLGDRLVSWREHLSVSVNDLRSGERTTVSTRGPVSQFTPGPGKRVAWWVDGGVEVRDEALELVQRWDWPSAGPLDRGLTVARRPWVADHMAWSPDGDSLLVWTERRVTRLDLGEADVAFALDAPRPGPSFGSLIAVERYGTWRLENRDSGEILELDEKVLRVEPHPEGLELVTRDRRLRVEGDRMGWVPTGDRRPWAWPVPDRLLVGGQPPVGIDAATGQVLGAVPQRWEPACPSLGIPVPWAEPGMPVGVRWEGNCMAAPVDLEGLPRSLAPTRDRFFATAPAAVVVAGQGRAQNRLLEQAPDRVTLGGWSLDGSLVVAYGRSGREAEMGVWRSDGSRVAAWPIDRVGSVRTDAEVRVVAYSGDREAWFVRDRSGALLCSGTGEVRVVAPDADAVLVTHEGRTRVVELEGCRTRWFTGRGALGEVP